MDPNKKIHIYIPSHDAWDDRFYDVVRAEAGKVFEKTHEPEFSEYVQEKNKAHLKYRSDVKKHGRGRVVYSSDTKNGMLGIIAQSSSLKHLKQTVADRIDRRASATLTDLHELYMCLGKSLDEIMGVPNPTMISQIIYLSEKDVIKLHKTIGNGRQFETFYVVRCVPLLGFSLLLWREFDQGKSCFKYKIVDSLGILKVGDMSQNHPHEILIQNPSFVMNDPSMDQCISEAYTNATELFLRLCQLSKGIIKGANGRTTPITRQFLSKSTKIDELPYSKYAVACGFGDNATAAPFTTESGVFENTVRLFFDDVVVAQKAQRDYDEMCFASDQSDAGVSADQMFANASARSQGTVPDRF